MNFNLESSLHQSKCERKGKNGQLQLQSQLQLQLQNHDVDLLYKKMSRFIASLSKPQK